MKKSALLPQLTEWFSAFGQDTYGEGISQEAHALQAAMLAEEQGESHALIIAALLHDIGHFIASDKHFPDKDFKHEALGAGWLTHHFSQQVTQPIALHVDAKRYLSALRPDYYLTLSEASKHSLHLQGGIMNSHAIERFVTRPFHKDALKLRLYDDRAKLADCKTPTLDYFLTTYVAPCIETQGFT